MASDEGDGEIIRELPATADSIKEPGMVKDYKVLVKTGNEFGSGTDANVFINIFGSKACFHIYTRYRVKYQSLVQTPPEVSGS